MAYLRGGKIRLSQMDRAVSFSLFNLMRLHFTRTLCMVKIPISHFQE